MAFRDPSYLYILVVWTKKLQDELYLLSEPYSLCSKALFRKVNCQHFASSPTDSNNSYM